MSPDVFKDKECLDCLFCQPRTERNFCSQGEILWENDGNPLPISEARPGLCDNGKLFRIATSRQLADRGRLDKKA